MSMVSRRWPEGAARLGRAMPTQGGSRAHRVHAAREPPSLSFPHPRGWEGRRVGGREGGRGKRQEEVRERKKESDSTKASQLQREIESKSLGRWRKS